MDIITLRLIQMSDNIMNITTKLDGTVWLGNGTRLDQPYTTTPPRQPLPSWPLAHTSCALVFSGKMLLTWLPEEVLIKRRKLNMVAINATFTANLPPLHFPRQTLRRIFSRCLVRIFARHKRPIRPELEVLRFFIPPPLTSANLVYRAFLRQPE